MTLEDQLFGLDVILENAQEYNITLDQQALDLTRRQILTDFYQKNPLAYAVAQGKDSYVARLKFVEEKYSVPKSKYSAFRQRITTPKLDETFDKQFMEIYRSMCSVIIPPLHPDLYTTKKRRESLKDSNKLLLKIALIFGGLFGSAIYGKELYDYINQKVNDIPFIVDFFPPVMAVGIFYGVNYYFNNSDMPNNLSDLKKAAQSTDDFLRKNYIEI